MTYYSVSKLTKYYPFLFQSSGCDVQDILPLVSSLHDRYEISTVLIRYTLEKLYSRE